MENYFFLKTMALQREPFPTMFYTINLSPLLITKKGFMPIIILSNYQVSTAFNICDYDLQKNSDSATRQKYLF